MMGLLPLGTLLQELGEMTEELLAYLCLGQNILG